MRNRGNPPEILNLEEWRGLKRKNIIPTKIAGGIGTVTKKTKENIKD